MKTPLYTLLLSLALGVRVFAATVVEYPFPPNVSSGAPVIHDPHLTAENPVWVGIEGTYGFGGSLGNAYLRSTNRIDTFDPGKYLTFTVQAEEGFTLRLDAFHFDLGGTTGATSSLSTHVEVRTSVDGFAASLPLNGGGSVASQNIPAGNSTPVYSSFTLSLGEGFETVSSVTFRLHVYLDSSATNNYLRLDNFALEGATQAIPEPSAGWLLMAAAGGVLLFTRRQASKV